MLIIIGVVFILVVLIFAQHVYSEMGDLYSDKDSIEKYESYSYYNSETKEFLSSEELVYYPNKTTGGNSGFFRFLSKSPNAPEQKLPTRKLTKVHFPKIPSSYALYWLGHSSAIIEIDGLRIIIDPVLGNAAPVLGVVGRYVDSPLTREELPDIDVVLISHDHYDHLEARTMRYLKDRNTRFIVPLGVSARLKGWGIAEDKITEVACEETISISTVDITATSAIHYSGRSNRDRNKTLWASYVIKGSDKSIFWSGDSGYGKHFKEIGEKYGPFDLACIEIDGWNDGWPNTHLFPEEAISVYKDVQAQLMLPIHWGVFDLALHPWNESIQKIYELAKTNNINLLTPIMGERVVPQETVTTVWW